MTQESATSIAKNTTVMMASQGATWISSFILMLVMPRHLGSEDFGNLYLAISLTMIFQTIIDFGGTYYIGKEVARSHEKAPALMVHSMVLRSLLWAVSIGAMILIIFLAGYPLRIAVLILILGSARLWEGVGRVLVSCFQGFEMMQYPSVGAIAERVFVTSIGVIALFLGANSIVIAAVMAAGTFLNFLIVARFSRRIVSSLPRIEWRAILNLLKVGLPYFLWSVFAIIYYRVDAVMLSLMTPGAVVGWYGAAYRFFDIFMFLPSIFSFAVFPVLSRLQGIDGKDISRVTCKSLDIMLLAGIPISIAVFSFSREIISLFFGLTEYHPSVLLLQIFAVGILLVYVDFILGTSLFASDRQRQWTAVAFGALLLNPVLNYLMIPYAQSHLSNGGIGSAIATLITELFVMSMALVVMPKGLLASARLHVQIKALGAGLLMGASYYLLRHSQVPWILQGILGVGVYGASLFILKAFNPVELDFLRRFFSFQNLRSTLVPRKEVN